MAIPGNYQCNDVLTFLVGSPVASGQILLAAGTQEVAASAEKEEVLNSESNTPGRLETNEANET